MKQRESIMAQKIEQLFHNRFELLDRFCDSYYSNQGREKEQAIVHAEMMALLDEFRDKNKTNAIEEIINSCYDNVLLKIREEFPSLKQRDITFLCYLLVGFSSRTISILLQEKIESVYRHKSRIKLTIERSDSPNKQHFSWIFSQQADGH